MGKLVINDFPTLLAHLKHWEMHHSIRCLLMFFLYDHILDVLYTVRWSWWPNIDSSYSW